MGTAEHESVTGVKIQRLETDMAEVKEDIKTIKETLARMDRKLAAIPEGGLQCSLHLLRLDKAEQTLAEHKTILDGLQAFKWRAVGVLSCVILVGQLAGSTILEKVKADKQPLRIELVTSQGTNTAVAH